ncbi:trehalose-phosphatase [Mycobacterium sherrisii]|uniref:Trehalose 6-phosphate phosphatase n=1 Tax=Mycobacterium sherrisii TaxID=243061 RepID=A0A1E3T4E4_9MYCO|nr:trehalose-phosphatase [Mycobacterium sherrisii]MCV7030164.1 trehalose-phosphatase [Mycobacterium sherrisii]ODR09306.1 trehalose-phosphatase [Mycobacterium sherrisii]ORW86500.1 trehalose phosphatase [Mycobacterium sherrisii]
MPDSEPLLIDPRRHDAVLFDAALDIPPALATQLRDAGVTTDTFTSADDLRGIRAGRCAVVAASEATATTARDGGFALVIDAQELSSVTVRAGDRRMSQLADASRLLDEDLPGRHPAVFFDFDGTLSDIVDDPDAAQLVAGGRAALQRLAARCPVAILSGRDLADVTKRVGLPGIWYAGSHGFELTAPDGTHHQNEAAAATVPVLTQAADQLRERLGAIPGVVVEHKRFGVAVHYRNAARERVGEVAAAVRAAGRRDGLRVTTGREVIELRPDVDWDKGKTLRWVIDHLAGAAQVTPIYLGDDITDEDAFDAVRDDPAAGIPILVRHNDDGDRATAAIYALDSPARVAQFVDRLARQLAATG